MFTVHGLVCLVCGGLWCTVVWSWCGYRAMYEEMPNTTKSYRWLHGISSHALTDPKQVHKADTYILPRKAMQ